MDKHIFVEIGNEYLRKYGKEGAIKEGYFMIWDRDKIKRAFRFGRGTIEDFNRYRRDNKQFCTMYAMELDDVKTLYPAL